MGGGGVSSVNVRNSENELGFPTCSSVDASIVSTFASTSGSGSGSGSGSAGAGFSSTAKDGGMGMRMGM